MAFTVLSLLVLSTRSLAAITSAATCSSDYDWMNNDQGKSPCLVAAALGGACGSNNYQVVKLDSNLHYSVSKDEANPCTCSWASYNLLSACTACQGFEKSSILNWAPIKSGNCSSFQSKVYFPPYPVQNQTSIPFWAGTDPATWQDGRFNLDQAKTIDDKGESDLATGPNPETKKSTTPIGAIVGGVVGGLAAIAIGIVAIIFIIKHNKAKRAQDSDDGHPSRPVLQGRSLSNFSQKTTLTGATGATGYFGRHPSLPTSANASTVPTSPTIHTHMSSTHSLSHFGSGNGSSILSAPGTLLSRSPPPSSYSPPAPQINRNPARIDPFTMTQPTTDVQPMLARKATSDSIETSPPVSRASEDTPARRRVNPPAYTPSIADSTPGHSPSPSQQVAAARREEYGHGHRPVNQMGRKGSQDTQITQTSWDSLISRSASPPTSGSVFGMDQAIGQINRNPSGRTAPTEHGSDIPLA